MSGPPVAPFLRLLLGFAAIGIPILARSQYDLNADIGETANVQDQYPDVVKRLKPLLQNYIDRGRSAPERHSIGKVNS